MSESPVSTGKPATNSFDPNKKASASSDNLVVGWKRFLYLVLAGIFFVFGAVGALLPVLPATPFLLLTSYFLLKTSPRLNAALLRSRIFGPILTDWQERGGVRFAVKLKAILVVLIAVGVTSYLASYAPVPTLSVLVGATIGIVVILRLPTARS